MLILILVDVQYSQKAAFNFEKGLNWQNHSSSGFLHLVKKLSPSKISNSVSLGEFSSIPSRYLENLDPMPSFKSN